MGASSSWDYHLGLKVTVLVQCATIHMKYGKTIGSLVLFPLQNDPGKRDDAPDKTKLANPGYRSGPHNRSCLEWLVEDWKQK
jgi:hypothetical protein